MTGSSTTGDVVKRLMDIVGSAVLLIATAPLQAAVALLIQRDIGRPLLFRQPRPGKDDVVFTLIKFRTMRTAAPGEGVESDGARLTDLGQRLRATSLDELPSLWNVLRGDMSLIGPRPLLVEYLDRYTPEQARRHEVRPGITGLAQVAGRNAVSWPERLKLDVEYVDSRSLRLDLSILIRSIRTVTGREGVTDGHTATMSPFEGHPRG